MGQTRNPSFVHLIWSLTPLMQRPLEEALVEQVEKHGGKVLALGGTEQQEQCNDPYSPSTIVAHGRKSHSGSEISSRTPSRVMTNRNNRCAGDMVA